MAYAPIPPPSEGGPRTDPYGEPVSYVSAVNPPPAGMKWTAQEPQGTTEGTPSTAPTKTLVKLTVNLGMEVYTALKGLAAKRGTTVTECLRHAISTEQWLQERQERGDTILVRDRQGKLFEVVFR